MALERAQVQGLLGIPYPLGAELRLQVAAAGLDLGQTLGGLQFLGHHAKQRRHGLAFGPEDRTTEGILADLSIRENIILALQARRGIFRYLPRRVQSAMADDYIRQLGIRTPDAEKPIGQLSGGNQQKALLARWLATEPKMLILDEPTRGIDIAAKLEIMDVVKTQCAKGLAILFISSEMSEVLRVSDRIVVLRDRQKVGEIAGKEADEQSVFRMIAGAEA